MFQQKHLGSVPQSVVRRLNSAGRSALGLLRRCSIFRGSGPISGPSKHQNQRKQEPCATKTISKKI
jgi:hypothetical protein